jgi:hypothetical protein
MLPVVKTALGDAESFASVADGGIRTLGDSMASLILRMNEGDAAVNRGVATLVTDTGYAVVLESALTGKNELLAGIKGDDQLVIHGHGSATKLGGKKAIQLAKLLADSGLSGPVLILLFACKGGSTGAPYALELKVALVQGHKIMCAVLGAKGTLTRNKTTGEWGVVTSSGKKPLGDTGTTYTTTKPF